MDLTLRTDIDLSEATAHDVRRIVHLWSDLRGRYAAGGPYLLGNSLSIADLILFGLVQSVRTGNYDYVATDAFDKWTHVVATYDAVKAHPIVAAEIAPKAAH
jgi:glutathione S-transferase